MPCPFCPGGGFGAGGGIALIINLIFTLILIAGLALLIWWIVKQARQAPPARTPSNRALDILNERYAKGEISKEEYEERKKTLLG